MVHVHTLCKSGNATITARYLASYCNYIKVQLAKLAGSANYLTILAILTHLVDCSPHTVHVATCDLNLGYVFIIAVMVSLSILIT